MKIIDRITAKDSNGIMRHSAENPHQLYALPGVANWVTQEPDGFWIVRGNSRAARIPYKGHTSESVLNASRVTCAHTVRILAPTLLGIDYQA